MESWEFVLVGEFPKNKNKSQGGDVSGVLAHEM